MDLDLLLPSERQETASWRWGTVTTVTPLRVILDGDAAALGVTPSKLGDVTVGSRVWCQLVGRRVVILGVGKKGTLLPGTNLGSVVTDGEWNIDTTTLANTIIGLPAPPIPAPGTPNVTPGALRAGVVGTLRVYTTPTRVVQEYDALTAIGHPLMVQYRRVRSGDGVTWGPWTTDDSPISVFTTAGWDAVGKALGASPYAPHRARRVGQEYVPATYWTLDGNTWVRDTVVRPVDSPCWSALTLTSPWIAYGTGWASPMIMRSREGIVVLRGLIKGGTAGSVITTLPVGYRPAVQQMCLLGGSDPSTQGAARVDVLTDGRVILRSLGSGGAAGYLSLAQIIFPCAEVAPVAAWTPVTFQNGWSDFYDLDSTWGRASYWTDTLGRVWLRGLVRRVAGVPGADTAIVSFVGWSDRHNHMATLTGSGFSVVGYVGNSLIYKTGSTDFLALPSAPLIPSAIAPYNSWDSIPLASGWTNYDATGNTFPPAGMWRAPDGLIHYRGLISGTPSSTIHGDLTPGQRSSITIGSNIYVVGTSGAVYGRNDLAGTSMSGVLGAAAWRSLDGIFFLKEA